MSNETQKEEEVTELKSTSLRRYLIGLSPQYWAYVPMLICDLLHLQLLDGVLCLPIATCCTTSSRSSSPTSSCSTTTSIPIPVSKCEIQGVIMNIQRQSKGVLLYLIDDGTGLMDCLDYDTNSDTDYYSLPSLVATHLSEARYYTVGDAVSIRGKIRIVGFSNTNNTNNNITIEVHVSSMTKLTPSSPHGLHWLTSIRVTTTNRPKSGEELAQSFLGPDMCNPLLLHDTNEHYFGKACKCDNLPQKDTLLYCHCHAKPEALDPTFTFRDALLAILIEMEQQQQQTTQTLYFFYKDIVTNATLVTIATQTLFTSMPHTKVHPHRLFVTTFRALREDGIVFLLDEDTDEYMLLSKNRVLLPYLLDTSKTNKQRPNYLRHVPNSRLKHLSHVMNSDTITTSTNTSAIN